MHPIRLRGARTHHLRGVSVDLQPGQLVAVTGVSGAGKSSLAFDTLYAEGQRRFVESFSPYARQFLERLQRPPMDSLDPVAAAVAVDRRAPIKSSRSTLATMADLEAYMSALFTREARPLCPDCGVLAERRDPAAAAQVAIASHEGARAVLTYPLSVEGTEAYLDVRESLLRDGYRRLLVDGETRDFDEVRPTEALASGGEIDVVVDRFKLSSRNRRRVAAALEAAWGRADGRAAFHLFEPTLRRVLAVRGLACPRCARAFEPPRPGLFSYQSPVGACSTCRGFGRVKGIDWRKVIPDPSLSLQQRCLRPWAGRKAVWERRMLRKFCEAEGIDHDAPWSELSEQDRDRVLEGRGSMRRRHYPGVRAWFRWKERKIYKMHVRVFLARFRSYDRCPACAGKRLSPASLVYRVDGLDLGDWHRLELRDARARLDGLALGVGQGAVAQTELARRLGYLDRVGLGYLTLDRQARTLSGGEAQRVSLTAALGTSLTGALFVLDEPTVGLHPSDLDPLIEAMRELADRNNVVLVVEHDPRIIAAADRVLELGPKAGRNGGKLVFDGTVDEASQHAELATTQALASPKPRRRRSRKVRGQLCLRGVRANNLQGIDVTIPLGVVVAVCGPSGSGKSTLVDDVLYRALARAKGNLDLDYPGEHDELTGAELVTSLTLVDQSPLGRTSRGNAATYSGVWTRLRALFAAQPEATVRGLTPAHFSFNVAAGRCDACAGEGAETVEMQFLADVRLQCPVCRGQRFRQEVLAVKLCGHDVAQVLAMTVDQVFEQWGDDAAVRRGLLPIRRLGLGYLTIGQPLSTLSGGEAQRLKLARALRKVEDGALLLLDEPSAGLHASEVGRLHDALDELVAGGTSVVVVDHDPGVILLADHCIELGPGGGADGGRVVAACKPSTLARRPTRTGKALRRASTPIIPKRVSNGGARGPDAIEVRGAREHNLVGVDVDLPHGSLIVVTGPSGSGKSSLAFDVVFAEGQRRFLETLTPYARQFLPVLPRPDVDRVTGVPPSVALEQRTARAGVNSTVATVTEVAHYLRLLFAKVGHLHCPDCDELVSTTTGAEVFARLKQRRGKLVLRAPVVRGRKGIYRDVFSAAERAGVSQALCDGELVSTSSPPKLARSKEHHIDLICFAGRARQLDQSTFDSALAFGEGQVVVAPHPVDPWNPARDELMSTTRTCRSCERALPELDPRWFSFNTAQGRCEACDGTGHRGGNKAVAAALKASVDKPKELKRCGQCDGARLAPIPRAVRLGGERYHELCSRSVGSSLQMARGLSFEGDDATVAEAPLAELIRRLEFVEHVGLGYLSLDRRARTLSGGEMQRLRLAAQLGSGLTGALYVLDEPTIGLHPRDTERLLANLRALVDTGSTVVVVEHDADTIRAADRIIDLGPSGGRGGGRIIAAGSPADVLARGTSPTARAMASERDLFAARKRLGVSDQAITIGGVSQNNLRIEQLSVPLARMVVVAGVSGSGKSTLVSQVLYPAVRRLLGRVAPRPGAHQTIELPKGGLGRAVSVDQSPIGRTSRSVPATFVKVWDPIRRLFAASPEARIRGYKPARFSFNSASAGGRCETCGGNGVVAHEMAFLPDVKTTCEGCRGLRFEPATLDVRYRGLSIGDVLRLTVEEAAEVFAAHPKIVAPLQTMCDLGVGYVQLGQGSPTLSGGEAQRLKLAKELTAGRQHKRTLYVLDEPTTGLHHSDVGRLIGVLDRLVQRGDSLVIIEHHPAVVAAADHVIELGPEGGDDGGMLVAEGSPEQVCKGATPTGLVLRRLLAA